MAGKGSGPADCSPLTLIAGDQRYRVEVDIEIGDGAEAGLLLFYNRRLHAGPLLGRQRLVLGQGGVEAVIADLDRLQPRDRPGQRPADGLAARAREEARQMDAPVPTEDRRDLARVEARINGQRGVQRTVSLPVAAPPWPAASARPARA
jgi:hypothetical protein